MVNWNRASRLAALRRHHRLVPLLAGVLYAVLVLVVAGVEYGSELNKLRRGAFSDTVSPTIFLEAVTLPGSLGVEPDLLRYPVAFNFEAYRHVVSARTAALVEVGLLQALLVSLIIAAAPLILRRYEQQRAQRPNSLR